MNFVMFEPKAIIIAIALYFAAVLVIGFVKGFLAYRKQQKALKEMFIHIDEQQEEEKENN